MNLRHIRQIQLPELGPEGQARIAAAHLLVVGAGGLGVPVLQYLVGAGVGRITLIDPDRVEPGNLHRQPIYGAHPGQAKVTAAAAEMRRLDPAVEVRPLIGWLDPDTAPGLVAQVDLVLDCADSHAASYILSDTCLAAGKPLILASALGLGGYVAGLCGGAPSLRALFPSPTGSTATCATAGVLGPVVGMLGTLQAQMALAVILGLAPSPLGQLIRYDMTGFRFGGFRFDGTPEPADAPRFIATTAIRASDLVLDLRDTAEAPIPVHPAALRLAAGAPVPPLPPDRNRLVLACRSGLRAWRLAETLPADWPHPVALIADPPSPTNQGVPPS